MNKKELEVYAREAAQAMDVGKSTMDKWVRQLRNERNGIVDKATALTPDQLKYENSKKDKMYRGGERDFKKGRCRFK